jgi:hypothetical protein
VHVSWKIKLSCESLKHAKVILKGGMATIHKIGENVCNWKMWGYTGNFMQYGNVSRKKIKENPVAWLLSHNSSEISQTRK